MYLHTSVQKERINYFSTPELWSCSNSNEFNELASCVPACIRVVWAGTCLGGAPGDLTVCQLWSFVDEAIKQKCHRKDLSL